MKSTHTIRTGEPTHTGRAVARWELSTEHIKPNTIVLRILKILAPVQCLISDYDGYRVAPKEGSLLETLDSDGVPQPFTVKETSWSAGLKIFLPGENG